MQKRRGPRLGRVQQEPKPVTLSILLAADPAPAATPDAPIWVQVASEGVFKGYAAGELEFEFSKDTFDGIIANFHLHPAFHASANGVGDSDVVAWDFHHASEMAPTSGTIPTAGVPAQGWVQDLSTRVGADGKCQLWALTRWLEPAKSYIKEQRYRWASVSVLFDAVDPVSGKSVGPIITSIALTNQPFIEGMTPLAASRQSGRTGKNMPKPATLSYWYEASSPTDAFEQVRKMLGLGDVNSVDEVAAEVAKVRTWVTGVTPPAGIDLEDIICDMRCIFGLPVLTPALEVLAQFDSLVAIMQADANGASTQTPGQVAAPVPPAALPAPLPQTPGAPALSRETQNMQLLQAVAEKLGVIPNDAAVLEAVGELTELRAVVASAAGLDSRAAHKVVLKAALSDQEVRAKYVPLLNALGVDDAEEALNKVAELLEEAEKMKQAAPELASLKAKMAAVEEGEADEDVEEAMEATGLSKTNAAYAGVKAALAAHRNGTTRLEWQKTHPKVEASKKYLTTTLAKPAPAASVTAAAQRDVGGASADAIDVSGYQGANLMLKACNFVKCSVQGADKWAWEQIHEHASMLVKSGKVSA